MTKIGGELEIDPGWLLGNAFDDVATRGMILFDTGRSALRAIARSLSRDTKGKRVLLPAYICDSVIQAFLRESVAVDFYSTGSNLRPDPALLYSAIRKASPDAVLFVNYFGFPPEAALADALVEIRKTCRVIEDCAHGSLIESNDAPVGHVGDVAITSLRKYLPVPDGAFLKTNTTGWTVEVPRTHNSSFSNRRFVAKLMRREFLEDPDNHALEGGFLHTFEMAERSLECSGIHAMSPMSRHVFNAFDRFSAGQTRRRNFHVLARHFAADEALSRMAHPLFLELPDGVSPLAFPVRVNGVDRDALRNRLRDRGLYLPVHWPVTDVPGGDEFREDRHLAACELSLVIDYRYNEEHMTFMLSEFKKVWNELHLETNTLLS